MAADRVGGLIWPNWSWVKGEVQESENKYAIALESAEVASESEYVDLIVEWGNGIYNDGGVMPDQILGSKCKLGFMQFVLLSDPRLLSTRGQGT